MSNICGILNQLTNTNHKSLKILTCTYSPRQIPGPFTKFTSHSLHPPSHLFHTPLTPTSRLDYAQTPSAGTDRTPVPTARTPSFRLPPGDISGVKPRESRGLMLAVASRSSWMIWICPLESATGRSHTSSRNEAPVLRCGTEVSGERTEVLRFKPSAVPFKPCVLSFFFVGCLVKPLERCDKHGGS